MDPVGDLCLGQARLAQREADVPFDRRLEQLSFRDLEDHPDPAADLGGLAPTGQVDPAHRDPAGGRLQQAGEQQAERRLPGSGAAHDRQVLPIGDVHRDVPDRGGLDGGAGRVDE